MNIFISPNFMASRKIEREEGAMISLTQGAIFLDFNMQFVRAYQLRKEQHHEIY